MGKLFEMEALAGSQRNEEEEYTVSQISAQLKGVVEGNFRLVRVRGEVSGYKSAASGHAYFSLKDSGAVLRAICWRDTAARLGFELADGLEVVATGRISIYEGQSTYQLIVQRLEPAGQGALLALLEKRKAQLAAEGLFDEKRKRPIPFLPKRIGIITSPTGAVIRDMLHRIRDRMPVHVLLWPVLVQGAEAAEQIAAAIRGFNALPEHIERPDVLIVARGGGSIEDLWAFNEEVVVRAAAESGIPLISAVGHETDTTLIDYAADLRAPTPTAAAEMAIPVRAALVTSLEESGRRLRIGLSNVLRRAEHRVVSISVSLLNFSQKLSALEFSMSKAADRLNGILQSFILRKHNRLQRVCGTLSPAMLSSRIAILDMRMQTNYGRLQRASAGLLERFGTRADEMGRLLESFNYKNVLKRGFAIVKTHGGVVVRSASDAESAGKLSVEFAEGSVKVSVDGVVRKRKKNEDSGSQSSLF